MNTSYVIPAVITAVLHAFLLNLNGPKLPRPPAAPKPPTDRIVFEVPIDVETPPPVIGETTSGGGKPSMGPPTLPEQAPVRATVEGGIVVAITVKPVVEIISERVLPGWRPIGGDGGGDGIGPGNLKGLIHARFLDNSPTAKVRVAPNYPYVLKAEGVDGEVLVDFWVDENGAVHDPVVRSSSRREFEEPTLAAVARWRFAPGLKNGVAVKFRMTLPVRFSRADL